MNETKAGAIFIEYCTQPDFDRVDFLIRMETESKTSPQSFARYMMAAWQFYHDKLHYKIQESRGWGNEIKDYGIPLLIESGGRFEGDLFFSQLPELLDGIKQYINKRCHLLPIITDGKTYHYYFDQSEIPENINGDYKKWFDARPKFQLTDAALKQWQTDYNFFLSTRPNLRALLLAKGIEYAEILLNHCKKHEPTDLQQIDSLERRIIAAKRMAGIEAAKASNKAGKKPKHIPSENERDALYYYYMGTFPKKGEKLYTETLDWKKDDYRLHSNRSKKSYNSKKGHMEAVLIRVLSEKKPGWEKRRDRIQQDIIKLTENLN